MQILRVTKGGMRKLQSKTVCSILNRSEVGYNSDETTLLTACARNTREENVLADLRDNKKFVNPRK